MRHRGLSLQLVNTMSKTPTRIRTKARHQSDGLIFTLLAFVLVSHFTKERNVLSTYTSVPCLIKESPCSAEFMTVSLRSRKRIVGVYNYQRSTQALKSKKRKRKIQNRDRRRATASERVRENQNQNQNQNIYCLCTILQGNLSYDAQ